MEGHADNKFWIKYRDKKKEIDTRNSLSKKRNKLSTKSITHLSMRLIITLEFHVSFGL